MRKVNFEPVSLAVEEKAQIVSPVWKVLCWIPEMVVGVLNSPMTLMCSYCIEMFLIHVARCTRWEWLNKLSFSFYGSQWLFGRGRSRWISFCRPSLLTCRICGRGRLRRGWRWSTRRCGAIGGVHGLHMILEMAFPLESFVTVVAGKRFFVSMHLALMLKHIM